MANRQQPQGRKSIWYFLLAVACGYMYYERYWKFRDCINDLHKACVMPDGTILNSSGQYWAIPTILIFIAAVQLWLRGR